jgi:uncharacterized protein (DUF362 family)
MTRRELLSWAASAPLLASKSVFAKPAPTAPVAIAKCPTYGAPVYGALNTMFDQIGGAGRLVKGKTVAIKLNMTGGPGWRFEGRPLGSTHYVHPDTIMAMVRILDSAGARRIRLLESCSGPLQEYMLNAGWNVRAIEALSRNLEFENTNSLGQGKSYHRFNTPTGAYIFPGYDLNHSYADADVYVSMAKLKNHATCGMTLSMKNMFGTTPSSIYGDDAGIDEPNENARNGRLSVCHAGKREPSKSAPQEFNPKSPRDPSYRMPRIVAELVAARPLNIGFVDGIETVTGGEGPWIRNLRWVHPGLMFLGTNPLTTDVVATATVGYDPRAQRGTTPFEDCDNMFTLAEALGVGTTDLKGIEVVGTPIERARFAFGPRLRNRASLRTRHAVLA